MAFQKSGSTAPVSKAFFPLRALQLIFAIIVAGICAYYVHLWGKPEGRGSLLYLSVIFGLIVGLATLVYIIIWFVVAGLKGGNRSISGAILGLEIVMLILWLCTSSLLTATVAAVIISDSEPDLDMVSDSGYDKQLFKHTQQVVMHLFKPLMAALAFSVANFILFVVTLALCASHLHKHSKTSAQTHDPTHG